MKKLVSLSSLVLLISFGISCKKEDAPLPDNVINFEAATLGFASTESEVEIDLPLSRAAQTATTVKIDFNTTGVSYGTHFTTVPAAASNSLNVDVPAGVTTISFKIQKPSGVVLLGTETVTFSIAAAAPLVVGTTHELTLSFSEIISTGSATGGVTMDGGTLANPTDPAPNSVYMDLSANVATSVDRLKWDLGFYNGSDFRVVLNYASNAAATATTKSDITQVTLTDADEVSLAVNAANTVQLFDAWTWTSDISNTAIAEIAATDADNKVYLFRPQYASVSDKSTWYKIKITRNGSGYKLQYAKIGETTINTLDITRNADNNFQFASFTTNNLVAIEPAKARWDIMWGYAAYYTAGTYAYPYNDFILVNDLAGVQSAEVLTASVSYDAFAESNIAAQTFSSNRDYTGSKWRSTSTGVKTDRFYVIKDPAGNYYKLKFISMGAGDGGVRGKPVIEYKLVKKG